MTKQTTITQANLRPVTFTTGETVLFKRVSAMKYDPRCLDRAWVASSIEAASDAVEAGAIALMAAAAVAPIRDLAQALRGAQARGNEVASTVAALRDVLIARGGATGEALARSRHVRVALNQTLCDEGIALSEGCEVAFFPPVTGG